MKKTFVLAALVLAQTAMADTYKIDANSEVSLNDCAGTLTTQVNNGDLNIVFRKVQYCSAFEVVATNGSSANYAKPLQIQGGGYGGSFTIGKQFKDVGQNVLVIRMIGSGKGDKIVVRFQAEPTVPSYPQPSYPAPTRSNARVHGYYGSTLSLNDARDGGCSGTVNSTTDSNGAINVVLHGLTQCSRFSIVSANGDDVNYTKEIQLEGNGSTRGGSFTIPIRLMDSGTNVLYIQMHSIKGAHSDLIELVAPAAPSSGGGNNNDI